jgi:gamma-glutamylcyclotransferase (GGCT)/AIG2-like uncharacterized protein YtfP
MGQLETCDARTHMPLIFQYGSNTSTQRLNLPERLGGAAQVVGLARTANEYELAFTYDSKGNACAAADLVHGRQQIYGVLYDIPEHRVFRHLRRDGLKTLDQIEGTGYQREDIEVELLADGRRVAAITYLVVDREGNLQTAPHYVKHIVEGLRSHGAPDDYIEYVKRRAEANNPGQSNSFRSL